MGHEEGRTADRGMDEGDSVNGSASRRPLVAVIDYGMGNLRSVEKALERAGAATVLTRDHEQVRSVDGIVLPGVGAFPKAMDNLRTLGLDAVLADRVEAGVPTLGICLGMQLLFESSSENEGDMGLGFLQGRVERLPAPGLKVPLIGWSPVRWTRPSALLEGLPDDCPFYFVHSFAPSACDEDLLGTTDYGSTFACAVERDALYGVQFHPEKSSRHGLGLLRNFTAVCAAIRTST